MKKTFTKIFIILIFIISILGSSVYSDNYDNYNAYVVDDDPKINLNQLGINYIVESNDTQTNGLVKLYERYYENSLCCNYYMFEFMGVQYYIDLANSSVSKPYNENEFNFFIKELHADDYVKIDSGYMVWKNPAPYSTIFAGGDSWKGWSNFYVYFYDDKFNLISQTMMGSYIISCSCNNGIFYCTLSPGYKGHKLCKSTDMINWEECYYDYENDVETCENIIYRGNLKYNDISFDNGNTFVDIVHENYSGKRGVSKSNFPYIIKNGGGYFYISKDGVYEIPINADEILNVQREMGSNPVTIQRWYFVENSLILESAYENKIKISLSDINRVLDEMSRTPYVQLNDKILGFSQPPVVENDRTLVPMRFLFEQMGANVTWNESAETATATLPTSADQRIRTFSNEAEKSVTFSIDNTNVTVNGHPAEMDVPARLVNDKTMVPLRFLSENLGYNVEWDEATNTAIITTE